VQSSRNGHGPHGLLDRLRSIWPGCAALPLRFHVRSRSADRRPDGRGHGGSRPLRGRPRASPGGSSRRPHAGPLPPARRAHHRTSGSRHFGLAPLLPEVAPTPLWMVYGTQDRFTAASIARRFTAMARRPRRSREIEGGNHTLDNQSPRLKSSLEAGLAWLSRPRTLLQTGRR
jgi:hypothetical protein